MYVLSRFPIKTIKLSLLAKPNTYLSPCKQTNKHEQHLYFGDDFFSLRLKVTLTASFPVLTVEVYHKRTST